MSQEATTDAAKPQEESQREAHEAESAPHAIAADQPTLSPPPPETTDDTGNSEVTASTQENSNIDAAAAAVQPFVAEEKPHNEAVRHVAFSPEVQIASVVFHKEKTQQEIDDEMDVFERLYSKRVISAAVKQPRSAPMDAAVVGGSQTTGDAKVEEAVDEGATGAAATTPPPVQQLPRADRRGLATSERRLEQDLEECTFKPKVTALAQQHRKLRNWDDFVKLQSEWAVQQKRKCADNKKRHDFEAGVGQLFDEIKRTHSKKIIKYLEKQHLYKSPQLTYKAGKASAVRNFVHQQNADSPSKTSSDHRDPVISDGTVFNRLYEEATVRDASLRVMEQTMIEKEARELFRPTTNESYWRGNTMLGARTPSRSLRNAFGGVEDSDEYDDYDNDGEEINYFGALETSIEEELLAKGEEYKRRRAEREKATHLQQEVHSFKPVMNSNSRRILLRKALEQEMERDEDMWFEEAATGNSGEGGLRNSVPMAESQPRQRAPSFGVDSADGSEMFLEHRDQQNKPKVKFDAEVFTARMQRRELDKAQKLSALRRSLKLEEISECTFRPSITQKSNTSVQRNRGGLSFSPQRKPNSQSPKSFSQETQQSSASVQESFSPQEITRGPAWHQTRRTGPSQPASTPGAAIPRRHAATSQVHDSDAHLQNLEDELRGVIAEWTTISASATA